MTSPELSFKDAEGLELALWHRKPTTRQSTDKASAKTLFFVHATGFHARCWDEVISQLSDFESWAIDCRSHGQSQQVAPPANWFETGKDLVAVGTLCGIEGAIGIGHSMGGHNLCVAASMAPDLFSGLILVDPIIFKPQRYRKAQDPPLDYTKHPTARRRNQFQSPAEMYERFKERPPFSRWQPAVLEDYCHWGLLPDDNNDGNQAMHLACAPLYEASIYANGVAHSANIYQLLDKIDVPVLVLRIGKEASDEDEMNFDESSTNPLLASCFPQGEDRHIPGYTHFFPMENPGMLASIISEFIETKIKT